MTKKGSKDGNGDETESSGASAAVSGKQGLADLIDAKKLVDRLIDEGAPPRKALTVDGDKNLDVDKLIEWYAGCKTLSGLIPKENPHREALAVLPAPPATDPPAAADKDEAYKRAYTRDYPIRERVAALKEIQKDLKSAIDCARSDIQEALKQVKELTKPAKPPKEWDFESLDAAQEAMLRWYAQCKTLSTLIPEESPHREALAEQPEVATDVGPYRLMIVALEQIGNYLTSLSQIDGLAA
jgi:hypothetical protein